MYFFVCEPTQTASLLQLWFCMRLSNFVLCSYLHWYLFFSPRHITRDSFFVVAFLVISFALFSSNMLLHCFQRFGFCAMHKFAGVVFSIDEETMQIFVQTNKHSMNWCRLTHVSTNAFSLLVENRVGWVGAVISLLSRNYRNCNSNQCCNWLSNFLVRTNRHLVNMHTCNYIMPQVFTSGLMDFTVLFRLFSFSLNEAVKRQRESGRCKQRVRNNLCYSNVEISPKWTNHGMIQQMIESMCCFFAAAHGSF